MYLYYTRTPRLKRHYSGRESNSALPARAALTRRPQRSYFVFKNKLDNMLIVRLTLSERFGKMAQWSADRSARLENMRITRREARLHVRIERDPDAPATDLPSVLTLPLILLFISSSVRTGIFLAPAWFKMVTLLRRSQIYDPTKMAATCSQTGTAMTSFTRRRKWATKIHLIY